MGRACAAESPRYRDKGWDDAKVEKLLRNQMGDLNHGLFVAEDTEGLCGMALGVVMPYFFSADLYATDLVVYVSPGHRGGTTAIRLVKALENWALNDKGVRELVLGVSTGINPEQVGCVYKKLGFNMISQAFSKEAT